MKNALLMLALLTLIAPSAGCSHDRIVRTGGQVSLIEDDRPPEGFTIKRETLDHALAQGAGWFIRQVGVRPVVTGDQRFYGFQLTSLFPAQSFSTSLPIRVGDIVQRINGSPVERPEQFMQVWASLATASHLSIHVVRDGQPLLVTWVIEDTRPAPAVSVVGP